MPDAGRALPALPTLHPWAAPRDWRCIDFISDLHLAEGLPRTFDAWATHLLETPADAVLMLGDVFEVWVGDEQRERAFERRGVEVIAQAARQRFIGFMPGNRDFLVGPAMCEACGMTPLHDPTVLDAWGRRLLLTHGDALCLDDVAYQAFRHESRSAAWQQAFLALPLAERLQRAAAAREASDARRRDEPFDPALWADVDPPFALAWMRAAGCADLIHGHTHRPGTETLAKGCTRHVLTDWDLDHRPPGRAEVLRLTRDGLARVPPAQRPA